jgi:hypothetical protein
VSSTLPKHKPLNQHRLARGVKSPIDERAPSGAPRRSRSITKIGIYKKNLALVASCAIWAETSWAKAIPGHAEGWIA